MVIATEHKGSSTHNNSQVDNFSAYFSWHTGGNTDCTGNTVIRVKW